MQNASEGFIDNNTPDIKKLSYRDTFAFRFNVKFLLYSVFIDTQ